MQSVEEACLRRRPPLRQHRQLGGGLFVLPMRQNPLDHRRVFDASDDLDLPRAPLAGFDVDIKHPLQPLHPGHRLVALGGRLVYPVLPCRLTPLASPAPLRRCHTNTKLAIGCENPVKTRQICAWLWHQGSQLRNKVQRFEYDVGSAITVRCLQLVADISVGGDCQALAKLFCRVTKARPAKAGRAF